MRTCRNKILTCRSGPKRLGSGLFMNECNFISEQPVSEVNSVTGGTLRRLTGKFIRSVGQIVVMSHRSKTSVVLNQGISQVKSGPFTNQWIFIQRMALSERISVTGGVSPDIFRGQGNVLDIIKNQIKNHIPNHKKIPFETLPPKNRAQLRSRFSRTDRGKLHRKASGSVMTHTW